MARRKQHVKQRTSGHSNLNARKHQNPVWILEGIAGALLILGYMLTLSPSHKKIALLVFFIAYVLAGLGVVVKLFPEFSNSDKLDKQPSPPLETPTPVPTSTPMSNTNISSVNQSGGFTGINQGTVNLAPPPRVISPADRAEFISYLHNKPRGHVDIWYDASDPESNAFAEQLASLLNEAGYPATIGGGFMAAVSPPLIGVVGCVGDADHPPLYAAYVRAGLEHINIGTTGMAFAGLAKDEFRIQVGPNPAKFKQP
jgi:hypothetical protein